MASLCARHPSRAAMPQIGYGAPVRACLGKKMFVWNSTHNGRANGVSVGRAVLHSEPALEVPLLIEPVHPDPQEKWLEVFRVRMQVRNSEVDQFGVVSNTVFPDYLYHARCCMMDNIGCSVDTLQKDHGTATATAKMNVTFKSPLRPGDWFYAECIPYEVKAASVKLRERVVRLPRNLDKAEVVAAESDTTCLCLTPEYKPKCFPPFVREALIKAMRAGKEMSC